MYISSDERAGFEHYLRESITSRLQAATDTPFSINPLAIWDFDGLREDATVEVDMVPCPECDLDRKRLQDDTLMLRGMYDEAITTAADNIQDAILICCGLLWAEEADVAQTVLNMNCNFEGMGSSAFPVEEALRVLAHALQASFKFSHNSTDVTARFNYTDAMQLATEQIKMMYRGNPQKRTKAMLTLQVLNPCLEIPLPDFLRGDGSVFPATTFAAYCVTVLKHVGTALLPMLYGGKR